MISMFIALSYFQSQHSDRSPRALVLFFIDAGFASRYEAAFLHDSARGWIIYKVAANERFDVGRLSDVI